MFEIQFKMFANFLPEPPQTTHFKSESAGKRLPVILTNHEQSIPKYKNIIR